MADDDVTNNTNHNNSPNHLHHHLPPLSPNHKNCQKSPLVASPKLTFYVRALFDYNPAKDPGLPSKGLEFQHGDILYLCNASDSEWWQARKCHPYTREWLSNIALIPSSQRMIRSQNRRGRHVDFVKNSSRSSQTNFIYEKKQWPGKAYESAEEDIVNDDAISENNEDKNQLAGKSLIQRLKQFGETRRRSHSRSHKRKSKERRHIDVVNNKVIAHSWEVVPQSETILPGSPADPFYQRVHCVDIDYTRPVILNGVIREHIMQQLTTEFPNKFSIFSPYSFNRSARSSMSLTNNERRENLLALSIPKMHSLAKSGVHCIIDIDTVCVVNELMELANLSPIRVHVRLDCNSTSTSSGHVDEKQPLSSAQDYTAFVAGQSIQEVYEKVKMVIENHSGSKVWLPEIS